MLTHGSDCHRALSGPVIALVAVSGVQGKGRGIGTLPTLHWRCYLTEERVSSKKAAGSPLTRFTPLLAVAIEHEVAGGGEEEELVLPGVGGEALGLEDQ